MEVWKTCITFTKQNKTTMENSSILSKVKEYKGNNGFILSLQGGLNKYGSLTPKQLSAADSFFSKFEQPKPQVSETKEINVNLKVSKFIAKRIGRYCAHNFAYTYANERFRFLYCFQ